jgi:DnaJ-class molecular chaperone
MNNDKMIENLNIFDVDGSYYISNMEIKYITVMINYTILLFILDGQKYQLLIQMEVKLKAVFYIKHLKICY